MLVLTRRVGEKINIGDYIVVTVLDIKGNQVKIGVEAPPDVAIHRKEIYERIMEQNIKSSGIDKKDIDFADSLLKKKEDKGDKD